MVSSGNLWSYPHGALLNYDIDGTVSKDSGLKDDTKIWTGTSLDGTKFAGWGMGADDVADGDPMNPNSGWVLDYFDHHSIAHSIYGISDILIAVPEPSTVMLATLGGLAALACSFQRKRS